MKACLHGFVAVLMASLVFWGCGGDDAGGPADTGIGVDTGPGDGSVDAPMACPAPTAGPTMHAGAIVADETWAADGSPHIVTAHVRVESGATLTIEPCAVVQLNAGRRLSAGTSTMAGHLVAEGTATQPIAFVRAEAMPWEYIFAGETGTVRLAYAMVDGGGANTTTYDGASLVADGPTRRPYVANLFVNQVTVTGSAGYGVLMRRHASFMAGSSMLTVMGSGASDVAHPAPVRIDSQAVGTLPAGTYTGNATDEIEVDAVPTIEDDTTYADLGVPYRITGATPSLKVRRAGTTGPVPTLTVEAGAVLAFDAGGKLSVGWDTAAHTLPGALLVQGTAAAPVVFTSAAATPAAGDWVGIGFATPPDPATSAIDYALVQYAGARNALGGYSCTALDGGGTLLLNNAAIFVYSWMPAAAFVTNTTIQDSAGWGILRGWEGAAIDFTPTNTFMALAHCDQSDPRAADGTCTGEPLTYACAPTP